MTFSLQVSGSAYICPTYLLTGSHFLYDFQSASKWFCLYMPYLLADGKSFFIWMKDALCLRCIHLSYSV